MVIQKRLGHRDLSTTADTYSHLLQNAQNEAVETLSAMMKKATAKPDDETCLVSTIGVMQK